MKFVLEFLTSLNIDVSMPLVVAVSYGPDSMGLLDIITKKYPKNKIICAHVHHNHRKESDDEASALKSYCKSKNIVFELMKIEKYSDDKFTEEEARNKRYIFFESLIKKYKSKYLFTAHHGDDLVETILMRMVRGSSFIGYAGIKQVSKRKDYNIIRPLLFITKDDITKYCLNNNVPYSIDNSNFEDEYTRNRYRKYILPVLKEESKLVHTQFLKFSKEIQQYDEYFEELAQFIYNKVESEGIIDISILINYEDLIIKRVLMKYLFNKYGNDINKINSNHINGIIRLIKSNKPNAKLCLPNKINIIKSYNRLYFDNNLMYNDYYLVFKNHIKLSNGWAIKKINSLENTSNYVAAFDSNDINFPIYVRNVKRGDKISILGLDGSKKVHDIFITEKVPKIERNNYPILVDAKGKVIWLPGLKKSKYDKSKIGKYDIILKYYKEGKNEESK